jgi:hypothetical protein
VATKKIIVDNGEGTLLRLNQVKEMDRENAGIGAEAGRSAARLNNGSL